MENSAHKAGHAWQAVLGKLQLRVTRPSYETWLKDTVGLDLANGVLAIGTPNTFVAEMLEQRMYSLITQAVESVVGSNTEVRFTVLAKDSENMDQPTGPSSSSPTLPDARASINSKYTFDSFIVGSSNELAHAASLAVAEMPGALYNPLFIYSRVGLGKTHLLHAIGQEIASRGMSVIYATTEEFTNEYIKAIREGKAEEFRHRYRSADALLLDDIQFIIGKEQTQEGFFHTFNALHLAGRQVVISSDRPASDLTLLEDRVRSRLGGGLVVDIQPPDLETRLSILKSKARQTGQEFPAAVLQFLAENLHKNIRELEGGLTRVAAYSQFTNSRITPGLVKLALTDTLSSTRASRVTDQVVLDTVSKYFSIDKHALTGKQRDKHTSLARQITMFLLREDAHLTLSSIGHTLGGKDHTTVLHGCQRIASQISEDSHLRRDIINLREALAAA